MRSIKGDIQTEEYRGYRDYLYQVVLETGIWKEWSGCSRKVRTGCVMIREGW